VFAVASRSIGTPAIATNIGARLYCGIDAAVDRLEKAHNVGRSDDAGCYALAAGTFVLQAVKLQPERGAAFSRRGGAAKDKCKGHRENGALAQRKTKFHQYHPERRCDDLVWLHDINIFISYDCYDFAAICKR